MMLERVAFFTGTKDEKPNIDLACELSESKDTKGIQEIVDGLDHKDKRIANDCIKVLYKLGERSPELIAPYVDTFIRLLKSKNNRLVWGAMTALAIIADLKADIIYQNIKVVKDVMVNGSVIAVDQSVTVLAKVCKQNHQYEAELFPTLLDHLKKCRPKEVAQHAERMSVCVNQGNFKEFQAVLQARYEDIIHAQQVRVNRLLKN
ncbi:MAG: hypothetical protein PUC65_16590 [Clostridiales bacterium]|nr:hypothetical protein [Clostridiales bacterium]